MGEEDSMSLAIAEASRPALALEELTCLANEQYEATVNSLQDALGFAIECGGTLIQIRELLPDGVQWGRWADENLSFARHYAEQFMRLAYYKDHLPPEAFAPYRDRRGRARQPTFNRALAYVRGLPPIYDSQDWKRIPDGIRQEAKTLRKQGAKISDISEVLGISKSAVNRIVNPEYARREDAKRRARQSEAKRARRALRLADASKGRAAHAKKVGGALGQAYSNVRTAAQKADKAMGESQSTEERKAISSALEALHKAEDLLTTAVRCRL